MILELFRIPVPLMVRSPAARRMVYGFVAARVNVMPSTSIFAGLKKTLTVFEKAKVAVSAGALGTVLGVQLPGIFQSPEVGLRSYCALPAWANVASRRSRTLAISSMTSLFTEVILQFANRETVMAGTTPSPARFGRA